MSCNQTCDKTLLQFFHVCSLESVWHRATRINYLPSDRLGDVVYILSTQFRKSIQTGLTGVIAMTNINSEE